MIGQRLLSPIPGSPTAFDRVKSWVRNEWQEHKPTIPPMPRFTFNQTATPTPNSNPQTWEEVVALADSFGAPVPANRYEEFGKPTPTPMPTPTPTPTPLPNRIAVPSASSEGERVLPQELTDMIMKAFDPIGEATNSARVLHHPSAYTHTAGEAPRPKNTGENTGFVTGKGWNDYNYNKDGSVKFITNPFTKEQEKSEDRGLFRINNATFYDLQRRKGKLLTDNGITSYEDMYDPDKNIIVAKMIQKEGGWKRWYAAPKELRE